MPMLSLELPKDAPALATLRALLSPITITAKIVQRATAVANSGSDGGKTRMKPLPLIRDEKLDTQKGMANRRNVCQRSRVADLNPPTLRISATPMTALILTMFNQILGDGSK